MGVTLYKIGATFFVFVSCLNFLYIASWFDDSPPMANTPQQQGSGPHVSRVINFLRFMEQPAGWSYKMITPQLIEVMVPHHIRQLTLTPLFDSQRTYIITPIDSDIKTNPKSWKISQSGIDGTQLKLTLDVHKFIESGAELQKFMVDFGRVTVPVIVMIHISHPVFNFLRFKEDQVGWVYNIITPQVVEIQVSVYISELALTPLIDVEHTYEIVSLDDIGSKYWRMSKHHSKARMKINIQKHINKEIVMRKFSIDFGEDILPITLLFHIDRLDYKFDHTEWLGYDNYDNHIGSGKFGEVSLVTHKKYNIKCALKKREVTGRFYNETRVLREYRNASQIIDVLGWAIVQGRTPEKMMRSKKNDTAMILLELMDGNAHRLMLNIFKKWNEESKFSKYEEFYERVEHVVSNAMRTLVEALILLETRNYVHFDLKPSNLLYKEISEWEYVWKLVDFGTISYMWEDKKKTKRKLYFWNKTTWHYAGPEQLRKNPRPVYDGRGELFGIGALTYDMLTQSYPWQGNFTRRKHLTKEEYLKRVDATLDYELCDYCYDHVYASPIAKDFMNKLLRFDPATRMSLQQAITHPFLTRNFSNFQSSIGGLI